MKKLFCIALAITAIATAYCLGFWWGDNVRKSQNPILKYAKKEHYKVIHYKEGLITKRVTAEKIGEAVLTVENKKGEEPVKVYYDEESKFWRIDGSLAEGWSNRVNCVLINVDGQFGETVGKVDKGR